LSEPNDYRVSLDAYSGPLDLLLFLIRRDEVDVYDIPIARITSQFVEYVDLLQTIDPDSIGDFLVMAATLMEIKSRLLLPKPPPEEVETEFIDPRLELVHQLLEYKKFKDAARTLEDAAGVRSEKHARQPVLPPRDPNELEIENLDIWDLFEAFNKILKQIGKAGATYKIDVDDTPIALHAEDVLDSLERAGGGQPFEEVFAGRSRGEMIGLFLALLELIRQHRVRATQERPFAPILLVLLDRNPLDNEPEVDAEDVASAEGCGEGESDTEDAAIELAAVDDDVSLDDDLGDEFSIPDLPEVEAGVMADKDLDRAEVVYDPHARNAAHTANRPVPSAEPHASACANARAPTPQALSPATDRDNPGKSMVVDDDMEDSPDETQ